MISVVIPCYRAKSTVDRAIESVLQADQAQVLVVDDACPEGTGAHVETRYVGEPRVKVIANEENLGLGATRNAGIACVETDFVSFLDADDYWTESEHIIPACEAMLEADAEAGFMPTVIEVEGGTRTFAYPDYELIEPHVGQVINIRSTPSLSVIQPCWSMIYRRKFLIDNQIRFHRRKFEDHDFGLEVVLKAQSLLALRTSPVMHYDKTQQGTLSSTKPDEADHKLLLEHVTRVSELIEKSQDLNEQSRAERANHYTLRILVSLLSPEHQSEGLILESYHKIIEVRSACRLSEPVAIPAFQSELTKRLLSRHPHLLRALDPALKNPSRFLQFVRLLRFVRAQPPGKARMLAKLGLRIVSKPWR